MKVALAQIAPVFLNRTATLAKVLQWINRAAAAGCELVAFGETIVPAYPLWICRTDGARWNAPDQKRLHARYLEQAVVVEEHLHEIRTAAAKAGIAVILGVAERAPDRGGNSIFCSRIFISGKGPEAGSVLSVHRKMMPTYEERLAWAAGDGAGLVTHHIGDFRVGALNCWENWMPLARAALYAAGEDIHVMLWPGSAGLTCQISQLVALESRSYVLSVSGVVRDQDIPIDVPERDRFVRPGETLYDGGSCIVGPDGKWIVEPVTGREELILADLDIARVREERQNFDPAGHYARPDILRLTVDRRRHSAAEWIDDPPTA
jgi:nitrilase